MNIQDHPAPRKPLPPGQLLTTDEAAAYLSVSRRWLEQNPDIPRIDLARSGMKRSMPRYRVKDLDGYAARRLDRAPGVQE